MKIEVGLNLKAVVALLLTMIIFCGNFAVSRTITDSSDTVYTQIICSNGNIYPATAANLQTAIYAVDNSTDGTIGWVDGAGINISISNSIKVTNNIELRNLKLYVASSTNKTAIVNYYYGSEGTGTNYHIYIHDVYIDGNGANQPEWNGASGWAMENLPNAIYIEYCNNVTIENIEMFDMASGGIFVERGKNIIIDKIKGYDIGALYKNSGHGYDDWYAVGVWLYNCSGATISNVIMNNTYAGGIAIESHISAPERFADHDVVVSNCFVSDSQWGYYTEDCTDVLFSNCIANDCVDNQISAVSRTGFLITDNSHRISLVNCEARYSYYGFFVDGDYCQLTNCISKDSSSHGFYIKQPFAVLTNCQSYSDAGCGFRVAAYNASLTGCSVISSGVQSIYIKHSTDGTKNGYTLISGCIIYGSSNYGIDSYASNVSIVNNILRNCAYGISFATSGTAQNITCINNQIINTVMNYPIIVKNTKRGIISNNYINWCGAQSSTAINLTVCENISVTGNVIQGKAGYYPRFGIKEFTSGNYNFIVFNKGIDISTLTTIIGTNSKVNFTGIDNWNWDV